MKIANKLFALLIGFAFIFSFIVLLENKQELHGLNQQVIYKVDDVSEANQLADEYHLQLNHFSPSGIATFTLTDQTDVDAIFKLGFDYNTISTVFKPPWERTDQDPYLNQQYALTLMDTIEAWDITEGSADVVVAVIDTGIDINHEEFFGRISDISYNALTNEVGIEDVVDDYGHGTMVAGVIAANKNNSLGIAGMVSNIEIMVIKANNENEGNFQDSVIAEGIYYAVDHGADIINLSIGNTYKNVLMETAVKYAYENDVIMVAAAGNDAIDAPSYPAAFESTISVSAVDSDRIIANFSNFGDTIDISAPGDAIITTVLNNGFGTVSGTSFAAPHVTSVFALMLSYFPTLTNEEITQRVLLSSMDEGVDGIDEYYGYGIANTYDSLNNQFATITFETNGGSPVDTRWAVLFSKIIRPEDPVLADHVFDGWYTDPELNYFWDFDSTFATEDMTLYAKFNSEYHTVTFVSEAEDIEPMIVYHGDTIELPITELSGYNFLGWTIDSNHQIPYDGSPISGDLTLYAHFEEITYLNVDLYIDDTLVENLDVGQGTIFQPPSYEETGYTFDGWYIDSEYTTPFDSDSPIDTDLSLYGKLIPIYYQVTLINESSEYDSFEVPYGEVLSLPSLEKENFQFLGWFYSLDYTEMYDDQTVTNDITLYARYEVEAYLVTYIIEGSSSNVWYTPNGVFEPDMPSIKGYTFIGWYLDEDFTNVYTTSALTADITLYAKFEMNEYTIRFYDYDEQNILHEYTVDPGTTLTPPDGPDKPDTTSFTYQFLSWSETTINIYEDLDVYPIYQRTFIDDSIQLQPGIDTINENDTWIDGGLTEIDDYLSVEVIGEVNASSPAKYKIYYNIYDEDALITTLIRVVRVIESESEVIIELNPAITTIVVGGIYQETGAITNTGSLTIISNVDTSQAGTYTVIYQVIVGNTVYEKTRYVHVIEVLNPVATTEIYIAKKEDDIYVA